MQLLMDTYATLPVMVVELNIDWSMEDYDTKLVDSKSGAVYDNIGSRLPEGIATTWEEYKAKMEAGTLTVDDMRQLMHGVFRKHNEDGSEDYSWYVRTKDEDGFNCWLLDDGTQVHSGEKDPVSGFILSLGDVYTKNWTEEDWAALEELKELGIFH